MSEFDIDRLSEIERINVIGTSGSGKSTFGRQLAEILELPYVEMDSIFWQPNWTESSDEQFLPKIESITDGQRWVLDGNYSRTKPFKWRNVQLVVWLDMSFVRTLYQVTSRSLKRAFSKSEIWSGTGNRESLRRSFLSRESVILWAITSYARNRRRYAAQMESSELEHIWFVRLRSNRDIEAFLKAAKGTRVA